MSVGLVLLGIAATADATYRVDWPALEQAWNAYLARPSVETAAHIQSLLPARRGEGQDPSFDVGAATRILDRLGALETRLRDGPAHAFDVAFALRAISDGDYSEWLSEMLGASARTHPVALLRSMKVNEKRLAGSCRFVRQADPDEYDTDDRYRAEIEARRASIFRVSESGVAAQRECVLAELEQALGT